MEVRYCKKNEKKQYERDKSLLHTWKVGQKDYMLWEIKFLAYFHLYEFGAVLD